MSALRGFLRTAPCREKVAGIVGVEFGVTTVAADAGMHGATLGFLEEEGVRVCIDADVEIVLAARIAVYYTSLGNDVGRSALDTSGALSHSGKYSGFDALWRPGRLHRLFCVDEFEAVEGLDQLVLPDGLDEKIIALLAHGRANGGAIGKGGCHDDLRPSG
jgi:hypothetical protein